MIGHAVGGERFTDRDLPAVGGEPWYRIFATNAAGDGEPTQPIAGPWLCAAPTMVWATEGTNAAQVQVRWQRVDGASAYRVYRADERTGLGELLAEVAQTGLPASDHGFGFVDLWWEPTPNPGGYSIERAPSQTGPWSRVYQVRPAEPGEWDPSMRPTESYWLDATAPDGRSYYRIRALRVLGQGRFLSGPYSAVVAGWSRPVRELLAIPLRAAGAVDTCQLAVLRDRQGRPRLVYPMLRRRGLAGAPGRYNTAACHVLGHGLALSSKVAGWPTVSLIAGRLGSAVSQRGDCRGPRALIAQTT